jgi:hypothetical protein
MEGEWRVEREVKGERESERRQQKVFTCHVKHTIFHNIQPTIILHSVSFLHPHFLSPPPAPPSPLRTSPILAQKKKKEKKW